MTAGHAPHNPDQPSSTDDVCAACKAAPAVLTGVYNELPVIPGTSQQQRLPWCEPCAASIAAVLVAAGYVVTLVAIPHVQLVCRWGEHCGRLAVGGYQYCTSHLRDLEQTYRAGDDAAGRPPALEPWCLLCQTRHDGECPDLMTETAARAMADLVLLDAEMRGAR